MRKNVSTIQEDAPFNEILIKISHDKYDRFPIVDNKNNFLGMIDYRDIRDIIVDESLKHLIVAKDLVNIMPLALFPDQTLGEALRVFQSFSDITYLPVVDRENPKILLGMINQNDLLAAFRIKNE
jgi:CBS domain-containing protein